MGVVEAEAPAAEVPTLGSAGVCEGVEPGESKLRVGGEYEGRAGDELPPSSMLVNGFDGAGLNFQDMEAGNGVGSGWSMSGVGASGRGLSRFAWLDSAGLCWEAEAEKCSVALWNVCRTTC